MDWTVLDEYLASYLTTPELRATVRASTFVAALEMVREGLLELQQDRAFAPIWVKQRTAVSRAARA